MTPRQRRTPIICRHQSREARGRHSSLPSALSLSGSSASQNFPLRKHSLVIRGRRRPENKTAVSWFCSPPGFQRFQSRRLGLPLGDRRAVQACNSNKGGLSHYPERPTPPVLYVRWPQSAFHSHNDTSGPELRPFSETSQTPQEKKMVHSRESPSNHSSVGDHTCVSGRSRRHTKAAILGRNPC